MPPNQNPEQSARDRIDQMLAQCGWVVQDKNAVNSKAGLGMIAGSGKRYDYVLARNRPKI